MSSSSSLSALPALPSGERGEYTGSWPVLTAEAMREADRFAIETYGIPGFTLMESAGRAAADRMEHTFGAVAGKTVSCFCGKGNNGGDGLVVARVLHARGATVRVLLLAGRDGLSEDAARNLDLLQQLAEHAGSRITITYLDEPERDLAAERGADLYVDALLGTGLTSDLRAPMDRLVAWLNAQPAPRVALDVPTGLHSDTGAVLGAAVAADLTVTMAALKAGLLMGDGPRHAGHVEVVEIGIPAFALERARQAEGCALYPTDAAVQHWLPARGPEAHKYSVGLALVVGGAQGMTGAPVIASLAAARAGAGYVQCACQAALQPILAQKLTTVPTLGLPDTEGGGIDPEAALEALSERLGKAQALLVGPGLGQHPDTQQFIRMLLRHTDLPVVLDADGLNALAGEPEMMARHAQGRWVLTPHMGEFKRLAGDAADLSNRIRTAQQYARRWNCVLILKGLPSVAAGPDGTAFVNATGNPALATAGTGDMLAGLCAGLLAQGCTPLQAAAGAMHLGGAAADRYVARFSPHSMIATDLLDHLPFVFQERFS